jgi:hypothetical protein
MRSLLLSFSLICFISGLAVAELFSINPREAYLRTNQDSAYNAVPFALSDLSLFPGDYIRLQRFGDYRPGTASYHHDTSTAMIAVFSGSNILLSSGNLNRVQDAIDAGIDYSTGPTYRGSLTTDIPQDFFINDVYVQIPQGAAYLFITTSDTLYHDNTDPDGDFSVGITLCVCPIGDLNSDCLVNFSDFCILASQWQDIPADISADIYPHPEGDGFVDILDLTILADNWLAAPNCE